VKTKKMEFARLQLLSTIKEKGRVDGKVCILASSHYDRNPENKVCILASSHYDRNPENNYRNGKIRA